MMNIIKKYLTFLSFLLLIFNYYPISKAAEVGAIADDLAVVAITPKPIPKDSKITPGFFYRQEAADIEADVDGVYAQEATYYGESLFVDDTEAPSIKEHVFSQSTDVNNWMGVVFFGVWSWPEEGGDEGTPRRKPISIPVRGLTEDKHMTYLNVEGQRRLSYRCIWKTGHSAEETKTIGGKKFRHIPGKGVHTETKFIEYIGQEETQKALWTYFLYETDKEEVPSATRKLECIGFTIYSTLDACDSCLRNLLELKQRGLPHLVPADIKTVCSPLPFYITYESKGPYRPFHPYETSFADASVFRGSIIFVPVPRPRLFRLAEADEDHEGDYHEALAKDEFDEIKHQDEIKFEEKEDPPYLILKINKGDPVRVKVA